MGFKCVKVLGTYNYLEIRENLNMHTHEGMLEICYLDKGAQCYQIQGKSYHMKGGDVLLTFPGEEHGTNEFPEEKGRLYWLILLLPGEGEKRHLLNLTHKETGKLTSRLLQLQSKRLFHGSLKLKNDLNKIFEVYREKDRTYKKIQITNLLLGFFIHLIELGERSADSEMSEPFEQICRYIQKNIHGEFKLEAIAEKWNFSLSHFKFRFKRETGITPADYILRQKISAAKELLQGDRSVHEVAYRLAFSSPSYFSTVFKRYTGSTPSKFPHSKSRAMNKAIELEESKFNIS